MHDDNRRGIAFMILAMAGLISNDTLMKLASEDLPVGQAIFLRGFVLIPVLAIAAWQAGAFSALKQVLHPAVGTRTIGEAVSTALYLTALAHLPLANATAILQLVPLLATAGAAIVLREAVGLRRWSAIAIGFGGVLLIVRPGLEGFNGWALVVVVATLFITLRDLSSRRLPKGTSTLLVSLLAAIAVSAVSLVMGLLEEWRTPTTASLLFAGAAGVILAGAYFAIVAAMRSGEVAVVAPFRYTILLWAILLQVAIFGVWPDMATFAGAAILVATGTYSFLRERRKRPGGAEAPAPAPR